MQHFKCKYSIKTDTEQPFQSCAGGKTKFSTSIKSIRKLENMDEKHSFER